MTTTLPVIVSADASRSADGFTSCGDAAVRCDFEGGMVFAVIDALGHGPDAAISAKRATEAVRASCQKSLKEMFQACDKSLTGVRGAVMSVIAVRQGTVQFAGVGNVELLGPALRAKPPTVPGSLGRGLTRFREFPITTEPGDRWLLVSDGIRMRGIGALVEASRKLPPGEAAQAILAGARRGDDDATVLVMDFSAAQ